MSYNLQYGLSPARRDEGVQPGVDSLWDVVRAMHMSIYSADIVYCHTSMVRVSFGKACRIYILVFSNKKLSCHRRGVEW